MKKTLLILVCLLAPALGQGASRSIIQGENMSYSDVAAINLNFDNTQKELLNTVHQASTETITGVKRWKNNLSPWTGSTYNLGASGTTWLNGYFDDLTVNSVIALKSLLQTLSSYRRPVLVFIDTNTVDVENNTGTANQTGLIFPDGTVRSVTEATSSAAKYRRFILSNTASFTSGSELGGLRSSVTNSANTWYAVYAVKSQINSANFVLAADTVTPSQANYATLNTNFGTSGWVYLGLVRNGNNADISTGLLAFDQTGHFTKFRNNASAGNETMPGIRFAFATSGTTLSYTYASGTGAAQIPGNVPHVLIGVFTYTTAGTNTVLVEDSGGNSRRYIVRDGIVNNFTDQFVGNASEGVKQTSTQVIVDCSIMLEGFFDNILGVGANPNL